jgi:hypothetical protein
LSVHDVQDLMLEDDSVLDKRQCKTLTGETQRVRNEPLPSSLLSKAAHIGKSKHSSHTDDGWVDQYANSLKVYLSSKQA